MCCYLADFRLSGFEVAGFMCRDLSYQTNICLFVVTDSYGLETIQMRDMRQNLHHIRRATGTRRARAHEETLAQTGSGPKAERPYAAAARS